MADTKISALTAVTTPASTDEFAVNQGGTSKKVTRAQTHALEAGESFTRSVAAGLTAGTTQTQAGGLALTSDINEVSVCANAGDTVVLPAASAGRTCTIINNGAQICKVFPASGDNLGQGVDAADNASISPGSRREYLAYDATNWSEDFSPRRIHLPRVDSGSGEATTPTLAFGDGNTGFYETTDNVFVLTTAGANRFKIDWTGATFGWLSTNTSGGGIGASGVSATVPTLFARSNDTDTGVGSSAADNLDMIAGGVNAGRFEDPADLAATETSLWLYDLDNGAIQQVTVGAADSGGSGFKVLRIPN